MEAADFILIQVDDEDEFYEVARVRPYIKENGEWDEKRGWYCEGIAQNNGRIYEFSLHIGDNRKRKIVNLGYPIDENFKVLGLHPVRPK